MEERPPIWREAANILNVQSRTADKGRSSSLGFGRGANNFSPQKRIVLRSSKREYYAEPTVKDLQTFRCIVLSPYSRLSNTIRAKGRVTQSV